LLKGFYSSNKEDVLGCGDEHGLIDTNKSIRKVKLIMH